MILNYSFAQKTLSNPDGTFPAETDAVQLADGPGQTPIGILNKSYKFTTRTLAKTGVTASQFNNKRFCISCVFKSTAAVTSPQTLVYSDVFPASVFLDAGSNGSSFRIKAAVNNNQNGWTEVDTLARREFEKNKWYTIHVVYDNDTLLLVLQDEVICVAGLPNGILKARSSGFIYFGTAADESSQRLNGMIAGVQIHDGIPDALQSLADNAREKPEWFITHKFLNLKVFADFDPGEKKEDIFLDHNLPAWCWQFENGLIYYNDGAPEALEMHGTIYQYYRQKNLAGTLGLLISNEMPANADGARKSLFKKGGIYWSGATGAIEVLEAIYMEYERLGAANHALGLPIAPQERVMLRNGKTLRMSGYRQRFEDGAMYREWDTLHPDFKAFELTGDIYRKYRETGAITRWGFPQSNETPVKNLKGDILGRKTSLEKGDIYHVPQKGTYTVYGGILETYNRENNSYDDFSLGLPTSDELQMPHFPTGIFRYNTFTNGSILWFDREAVVCKKFHLFMGQLMTDDSDDIAGENDVFFNFSITKNGRKEYERDFPEVSGQNIREINFKVGDYPINPNNIHDEYLLRWVFWDDDDPFIDEILGVVELTLNADNGWGMRGGGFLQLSDKKVTRLEVAIHPVIDPETPPDFWSFTNGPGNPATADITYQEYAIGFDVDEDPSDGSFTDLPERMYFNSYVRKCSHDGACYGFTLAAMYAWKNQSLFPRPLNGYQLDGNQRLIEEIQIRQAMQKGFEPIYWKFQRTLTGKGNDPKDVFHHTRKMHERNMPCIINLKNNGGGHAVYAIDWDDRSTPWRLGIFDPNVGWGVDAAIEIDPDNNRFSYNNGHNYDTLDSGKINFTPYFLVNHKQKTSYDGLISALIGGPAIQVMNEMIEVIGISGEAGEPVDDGSLTLGGENPSARFFPVVTADGLAQRNTPRLWLSGYLPWNNDLPFQKRRATVAPATYFKPVLRGLKTGDFQFYIKNGSSAYNIRGGITENEIQPLEIRGLGTSHCTFQLHAERNKTMDIGIFQELSVGGDRISIDIRNIPVGSNRPASLDIRPGLSGFDLIARSKKKIDVLVKTQIRGKVTERQYKVGLRSGGIRLNLSSVLFEKSVASLRISELQGVGRNPQQIRAR